MAKRVRFYLLMFLRIAVALGGVGYIVFSLSWSDHVLVAGGTIQSDGTKLAHAKSYRVFQGNQAAFDAGQWIIVTEKRSDGRVLTMSISTLLNNRHVSGIENAYQYQPGIPSTLKLANGGLLLLALILVAPIYPLAALRWQLLLGARGIKVAYPKAFKLTMVGCFFNYCMPVGSTGGDVAKAYYAAKGSGRQADAVMSVIIDRVAGLTGLLLFGSIGGLFLWHEPGVRQITLGLWGLMLVLVVGGAVYFNAWLREKLGINKLISFFPGKQLIQAIDQAAVAYRNHKRVACIAVGISFCIHSCTISSSIVSGLALGMSWQMVALLAMVMPVLFLGAALPISYQGLGVMEGIGKPLLVKPMLCSVNQLFGMLMLIRLYMVLYSLIGSLYLLKGDVHLHPQEDTPEEATPAATP